MMKSNLHAGMPNKLLQIKYYGKKMRPKCIANNLILGKKYCVRYSLSVLEKYTI